jgi:hypothetical protein
MYSYGVISTLDDYLNSDASPDVTLFIIQDYTDGTASVSLSYLGRLPLSNTTTMILKIQFFAKLS